MEETIRFACCGELLLFIYITYISNNKIRNRWCSWFRHCATSGRVMGSIPYGAIGFFSDLIFPAALWSWDREWNPRPSDF
jgi:hypothetical protein